MLFRNKRSILIGLLVLLPISSADHGYSAPSYSAPSYNAPTYEAPKHADVTHHHYHYYGAAPEYHAPKPSYEAPKPSYNAPKPSYNAPASSYAAPTSSYGAPAPSYAAPTSSYGAPAPAYGAPSPAYAAPAYAPAYGYDHHGAYPSDYGYAGGLFSEDPYLHVNKRELVGGALLLGAGIAKGVILTGLVNSLSSNTGVQIGKKK